MTNPNYIHEILLIDRSGSMSAILAETRGGIHDHIEQQRALPGLNTITIVTFNGGHEVVRQRESLATVKSLEKGEFEPSGMTALYDAMAAAIDSEGAWIASLPEDQRPHKVLMMVVTDGMENASMETTQAALRERVERQTNLYGWDFTYMAANQDAILNAGAIGIVAANAINFAPTPAGMRAAMHVSSAAARGYKVGGGVGGQSVFSASHVDDLAP